MKIRAMAERTTMTQLDTAALHGWLTDEITAATELDYVHPDAAADLYDRYAALRAFDGWLRTLAGLQHADGTPVNPGRVLALGCVYATTAAAVKELDRLSVTRFETRRKVYAEIVAELPRFEVSDPPPRLVWWERLSGWRRLVGAR